MSGEAGGEKGQAKAEILVTIPSQEEVMRRLAKADNNAHYIERLYPKIARQVGGRELYPMGVVLGITIAITEYTQDLPKVMEGMVSMQMGTFLEALIDDKEALETAKKFFAEAMKRN